MSDDPFVTHRGLLFTVAYEMLGSAVDAEDVLQESWLKWDRADRGEVRDPRAYLVRIVTRTALDRLRTIARRREEYVGPWLPEPLLTSPDVAEDLELADSLSTAMLLVLETLTPTERAVFLGRHDAESVAAAMIREMGDLPEHLRCSLTWDRGTELARYDKIQLNLQMPIYLCDPHSPWQRGTNENTNRLLRHWLTKGTGLSRFTAADLRRIAATLNARPRPTLDLQTPAQALDKLLTNPAAA